MCILAAEEVVADGMELILTDGKVLNELAHTDKSLWEKIRDWIFDIIGQIRRSYESLNQASKTAQVLKETMDSLDEIERLFTEGAKEAGERARAAGVETETRMNEENMHDSEKKMSIRAEYSQEIEEWHRDGRPDGESFVLGMTGDVLQGLGAIESDIYINGDKIKEILKDHLEMTLEEIKKIPQILEDPVLILKSRNLGRGGKMNSRMVIFGAVKAKNGQPVMSVLDLHPTENNFTISDMQKVTSAYTKTTSPVQFVKDSFIVYADKKRTASLLRTIGFQMPIELNKSGYIGSISYNRQRVNIFGEKFSDVFVEGQRKYSIEETDDTAYLSAVERGDMETAQRMVDEAAKKAGYVNLFYHGAKKGGGFTVFRDWSYFTENKAYAERYTDREKPSSLYKTYVKMDNTFDTRKAKDRKLFAEIRDEYGLSEIQDTGLPDWTDGYDIADYIDENNLDYDSIVLDEGGDLVDGVPISRGLSYVVRKSVQIKSADPVTYDDNGNVIPLSERFNEKNHDIRYSLGEDENGDVRENERLKAENKKLEERVQRMRYRQFRKAVESGEMEAKAHKQELSDGATTVLESIGIGDGRNHTELTRRMSELYARMAGEKKISYGEAFDEAAKISDWLLGIQPDIRYSMDEAMAKKNGTVNENH